MKMTDEMELSKAIISIRHLLDNMGQGLLTFGKDLIVHKDYSYECQRILGGSIANKAFPQLIYSDNQGEALFVEQTLREIFNCRENQRANVFISLLPEEMEINSKFIGLKYKVIDNIYKPSENAMMVIMTEVTEKKMLEKKVKENAGIMSMVANIAGNFSNFLECVKEFQYFYGSKLHEIIESQSVSTIYANVYRQIHTFKGNFSQFGMQSSVEQLHNMETALSDVGTKLDKFTREEICTFIYSFDILDFLDKDMDILQEKLGSHFLSLGDMVYVDKAKLFQIENEVINICSPIECRTILPLVRKLRYKSLKEMLSSYPDYTFKLAEKLKKPINTFTIEGDDLLLDNEKYNGFIKALGHVFRNSVDHGLESTKKRVELGKPMIGNIKCHISLVKDNIKINIEDDGGGICFDQIRNKAIAYELCSIEDLELLEEKQLIELIFKDNFSTNDIITELSGRGMGLYAVKSEVEKLGGTVEVFTDFNKGTRMEFTLPNMEVESIEPLKAEDCLQPLLGTTLDILKEHLGRDLNIESIKQFNVMEVQMLHYTSFINIRGMFDALVSISMDDKISRALLNCMVSEVIQEQQVHRYIKDVIAECTNMVLGNSIKEYPNILEQIIIGTPSVIYSASGDVSYEGNEINGYRVQTDKGAVMINIIQ
jgi:two-component system chemotaxis sensor kinase CheA